MRDGVTQEAGHRGQPGHLVGRRLHMLDPWSPEPLELDADASPFVLRGRRKQLVRAVDQHGQVVDVDVSQRRAIACARRFFTAALAAQGEPTEVITDRPPTLANVIEELAPAALHNTGQYENNRVACDHGHLKARLRPMRGLKTPRTANLVIRGHAFIQNLRRGHYEPAIDTAQPYRLATAFDELIPAI